VTARKRHRPGRPRVEGELQQREHHHVERTYPRAIDRHVLQVAARLVHCHGMQRVPAVELACRWYSAEMPPVGAVLRMLPARPAAWAGDETRQRPTARPTRALAARELADDGSEVGS
jgi:hypothetical protein